MNRQTSLILAMVLAMGPTMPAVAGFEVEDLESEKGKLEFEYKGDYSFGIPGRRSFVEDPGPPPDIVYDTNELTKQRHEIELGYGLTKYFKLSVGLEFEKERFEAEAVEDNPDFANAFQSLKATEIEFSGLYIVKPLQRSGFGLGLYGALALPLQSGEARELTLGPIVKWREGSWSVLANPFFSRQIGGEREERDERWDFTYAWQIQYDVDRHWALAVEGFGSIERLGSSGTCREACEILGDNDQHRVGPVVYYSFDIDRNRHRGGKAGVKDGLGDGKDDDAEEEIEVKAGFGVLFGLNDRTSDVALKWSLEVEF